MYDKPLGRALGGGSLWSGNSRRNQYPDEQDPGGYDEWMQNEQQLQQSVPQEPQESPIQQALSSYKPQNQSGSLRGLYNNTQQQSPVAQTGYQSMFFTPTGDMRKDLTQGYRNVLGREPDAQGFEANLKNPGGFQGAMDTLYNSPEYAQRQSLQNSISQNLQQATPQQLQQIQQPSNLQAALTSKGRGFAAPSGGWAEFNYADKGPGQFTNQLEGFNLDKLQGHQDSDTLKYVFARFASNYDVTDPEVLSKVVADMNANGFNVRQVSADSVDFGLGEGPMDVIRGGNPAGGIPNVGWQWIPAGGGNNTQPQGPQQQMNSLTQGLELNELEQALLSGDNNMLALILAQLQKQLTPQQNNAGLNPALQGLL